jgi:hypothetical protein
VVEEEVYLDWARKARAGIREVRRVLVAPTPETLARCQPYLAESIARLKELEEAVHSGQARGMKKLCAELSELRKDLRQVGALLNQASAFHLGWARLFAAMTAGYNRRGEPACREPIRRISIRG